MRSPVLSRALWLPILLAACSYSSSSPDFVTQPAKEAAVGKTWSFVANLKGVSEYEIDVYRGPAGMLELDEPLRVEWTPALTDLGEHRVVLDVLYSGNSGSGGVRLDFMLRVHQNLELGVTLSPRGHTGLSTAGDFVEHYQDLEVGRLRAFHGPWRASVATAGEVPEHALAAMAAARDFRVLPAVGFGWTDGAGLPDLDSDSSAENSWANVETRRAFLDMVTEFAATWLPPYLFLGNETNVYFESCTALEWQAWLEELAACAESVHAVSPETLVFTTFQLELLAGLGANAGWSGRARWELVEELAALPGIDAVGFTTYPFLEYDALAEVPPAHWASIADHWDGPIVFTEVAWRAQASAPYPGDELEQADFVSAFLDGIAGLEVEYAAWLFLHDWDQEESAPAFAATGLRDNMGLDVRLAEPVWRAEVRRRQRP